MIKFTKKVQCKSKWVKILRNKVEKKPRHEQLDSQLLKILL